MAELDSRITAVFVEQGRAHRSRSCPTSDAALNALCDVRNALAATGRVHWHGTCGDCRHFSAGDEWGPTCDQEHAPRDGFGCTDWQEREE